MKPLFLILAVLFCINVQAQTATRTGTVEYNKQQVPCYIAEYPYSQSLTEDAIKDRFKAMGAKGNNRKGFLEYSNIVLPEISASAVDARFKVEKKDKNTSTVYMIVGPVGSNNSPAIAGSTQDYSSGSTSFLNGLSNTTSDYSLEQEIKKQEEELKKAEKKSGDLVNDGSDMQRKLTKLQSDMEENRKRQSDQLVEVQKQKDALTQLQAKRRVKS